MAVVGADSDSIESLYLETVRCLNWRARSLRAIRQAVNKHSRSNSAVMGAPGLKDYDWNNIVLYQYTELLNFPQRREEIILTMLEKVHRTTGLSLKQLEAIFRQVESQLSRELAAVKTTTCRRSMVPSRDGKSTLLKVENLCMSIPNPVMDKLLKDNPDPNALLRLALRYELLGRSSGFFWSIDHCLYSRFAALDTATRQLPTLECFGSPFNHYLPDYCSLFPEDEAYGSKGNFFSYVPRLSCPVRFIFNPPYTSRLIEESVELLLRHLQAYPESEFVALLPAWDKLDGPARLSGLTGSAAALLPGREYTLYDYSKPGPIVGMRASVLIANIGNSEELSRRYVQLASAKLRQQALLLTSSPRGYL